MKINYIRCLIALLFLGAMYVLVPNASDVYIITVLNSALIFYVACLGINIMLGMGGMVSFAAIAFIGIGAYTSANCNLKLGLNPFVSMFISILVAGVMAFLAGLVLLRLQGTFFTFSTVALVQIAYSIFTNWKEVTGGPDGMGGISPFQLGSLKAVTPVQNYYILFTLCVLCCLFVLRLKKTNLGRALSSVRDNEIAAKVMGVNVYMTKVIAFMIAGMLAGLAGGMMVFNYHFVGSSSFTFDQSLTLIIMTMLGGVFNPIGVFLGTVLITMLPEWFKPLQEYIRLFYGLGVMFLMVFMPMGLWGSLTHWGKLLQNKLHLGHKTLIGFKRTEKGTV